MVTVTVECTSNCWTVTISTPRFKSREANVRRCVPKKLLFLFWTHNAQTDVDLSEELHFTNRIEIQKEIPVDREIEHALEQSEFPIDCRT
jgi:hypothetical protein